MFKFELGTIAKDKVTIGRMLLDNGMVVTRDGRVVGRLEVPGPAFELLWQPAAT